MKFTAGKNCFYLDSQPFFLYSGEIHYFRIQRELWQAHLAKLKASGANTVSTYIPWSWHEYAEGCFDFYGETDPQRDLIGFIKAASAEGLYLSVKPGPYILAEFEDCGIPAWLPKKYPEIQAQGPEMISYLHPTFQAYVRKWYDAVLPLISEYQVTHGGPIILMQVCNEVGVYNWLAGTPDTNKVVIDYYQSFLSDRYHDIKALNKVYGSNYRDFIEIKPPTQPARSTFDFVIWKDYHDFHRWYYAEYLSWLISEIRARGINVQLFHNIPGWVYGRGTEYPVNISFYSETIQRHPELLLGVDHIPENPNYRNLHDDLIINEMVRAVQGGKKPIWVAEQQAGTREHNVHAFPNEMELFYKACLARGIAGMNLYMFSQGQNPPRRGTFGPTFYWMTPLGYDATEKELYPVTQKLGRILSTFGTALLETEKRTATGVVFYQPYYHDEYFYPIFGGSPKIEPHTIGLRYNSKTIRNNYFFDGLLRIMVCQNRDFEFIDPQLTEPDPQKYHQLWVTALEYMDPQTQERLANYVEKGGYLFIWPGLPDRDLNLAPCQIMMERFGITEGTPFTTPGSTKIDILGLKDINVLYPVRTYQAQAAEEIAHTLDGTCCGLVRQVGQGRVCLIGTCFGYNIKEHLWAFEKLASLVPVPSPAELSNPAVQYHLRYGKDYAFLFLLNYTPIPQKTQMTIKNLPGMGDLRFPAREPLELPPVSGVIIPLYYPLNIRNVRLLWSTGEVLEIKNNWNQAELLVQPLSGNRCELALMANLPSSITINGSSILPELEGEKILLKIPNSGLQRVVLAW